MRLLAQEAGFDGAAIERLILAASEMADNLVRHAHGGTLTLTLVQDDAGQHGVEIETLDYGPGFDAAAPAFAGNSATGSLGVGLNAVNSALDELEITSEAETGGATRIVGRRWLRPAARSGRQPCPLAFGAASRPRASLTENGDAFIVKTWGESALVGVIDGLGHGVFAHRAAETARGYVEEHYDRPLDKIFAGVARACHATRGVVMLLARFDWGWEAAKDLAAAPAWPAAPAVRLTLAGIGNIEWRTAYRATSLNYNLRRGILGVNAPPPVVSTYRWDVDSLLILHSDGVSTHWQWEDFQHDTRAPAASLAGKLLLTLAKDADDATVVVVKAAEA